MPGAVTAVTVQHHHKHNANRVTPWKDKQGRGLAELLQARSAAGLQPEVVKPFLSDLASDVRIFFVIMKPGVMCGTDFSGC
jgi:hypothetical protein